MDELDRALLAGWERAWARFGDCPRELEKRLVMAGRAVQARPLRSWAVCVRACDGRIGRIRDAKTPFGSEPQGRRQAVRVRVRRSAGREEIPWLGEGERQAVEEVYLDAGVVRWLCGPVKIDWPGVRIAEAARLLGVNEKTVRAWGRMGKVKMERWGPAEFYLRRLAAWRALRKTGKRGMEADVGISYRRLEEVEGEFGLGGDAKTQALQRDAHVRQRTGGKKHDPRCYVLVWTVRALLPGGEVWGGDWGDLPRGLVERVPEDWSQVLERTWRDVGRGGMLWHWRCPQCARWVRKVYWPMRVWTIAAALCSAQAAELAREPMGDGFVCRRCEGLTYESAERRRAGDKMAGATWDRFVKRISGGVLKGREVEKK